MKRLSIDMDEKQILLRIVESYVRTGSLSDDQVKNNLPAQQ